MKRAPICGANGMRVAEFRRGMNAGRHCEERSEEAIRPAATPALDCFATLAMTVVLESGP
jgi:hypothetical protein